jgi:hypothetical protein
LVGEKNEIRRDRQTERRVGLDWNAKADQYFSSLPQIPKPNAEEGLSIGWPQQKTDMEKLKALFAEIKAKM